MAANPVLSPRQGVKSSSFTAYEALLTVTAARGMKFLSALDGGIRSGCGIALRTVCRGRKLQGRTHCVGHCVPRRSRGAGHSPRSHPGRGEAAQEEGRREPGTGGRTRPLKGLDLQENTWL